MRRGFALAVLLPISLGGCFDFEGLLAARVRPDLVDTGDLAAPADAPLLPDDAVILHDLAADLSADAPLPPPDEAAPDGNVPVDAGVDLTVPDLSRVDLWNTTSDLRPAPVVDLRVPDLVIAPDLAVRDLAPAPDLVPGPDLLPQPDLAPPNVQTYRLASGVTDVRPADVDGDGATDLLISCSLAKQVVVLLNDGAGNFRAPAAAPLALGSAAGYFAEPRDYDGDGLLDIILTLGVAGEVVLVSGKGDGSFGVPASFALPGAPTSIAAADFNRDKIVDIAVAVLGQTPGVVVLPGQAKGLGAAGKLQAAGTYLAPLIAADLDKNGAVDLVAGNSTFQGSSILVLGGKGDGTFQAPSSLGSSPISGMAAADFDLDGTLDLVTGDPAQKGIAVLRGLGNFAFAAPVRTPSMGSGQAHLAVGDISRSGKPDVALVENGSDTLALFQGKGDLQPRYRLAYATGNSPVVVRLADFDGNGHLDVVTGDSLAPGVTVILNP